jgi:site-specific DNA-methyltransferase (adenine-specific)
VTQTRASKHEVARQIRTGQHIPDILDCLAQLSNDEVPTPPKLARAMLDILPDEVWGKVDYVWLDPFCKSGIFLREAAGRLLEGLSDQIPDFDERRDHIYRNMLWGTSITEMTGMISRRSLYYSRDAAGPASVVKFDEEEGNLPFIRVRHTYPKKKDGTVTGGCTVCGAPFDLERGEARENYAYSFIHGAYPTKEMKDMKFDVIVGNPPYQIDSDGNTRTKPVYHLFVQQAIAMKPRYAVMITPSRWFAGGLGLDEFRQQMLTGGRIDRLVDYVDPTDCFPGVDIQAGVSFFRWDRNHQGPASVSNATRDAIGEPMTRPLDEFGILMRDNQAVPIVRKVASKSEPTVDTIALPTLPFGMRSNFKPGPGKKSHPVKVYARDRTTLIADRSEIPVNTEHIDRWKVLVPRAYGERGRGPYLVLGKPFLAEPGSACTMTYAVLASFGTKKEASTFISYLTTRLFRFLLLQRKITQDLTPDRFAFVPALPMNRNWSDADLYSRYGLTPDEVAYVESQVREMSAGESA